MSKKSIRKVARQNRRKAAKLARLHGHIKLATELDKVTAPGGAWRVA